MKIQTIFIILLSVLLAGAIAAAITFGILWNTAENKRIIVTSENQTCTIQKDDLQLNLNNCEKANEGWSATYQSCLSDFHRASSKYEDCMSQSQTQQEEISGLQNEIAGLSLASYQTVSTCDATLVDDYNALVYDYNTLRNDYNGLVNKYNPLVNNYNALLSNYNRCYTTLNTCAAQLGQYESSQSSDMQDITSIIEILSLFI
jgi:hypothetical protein